MDEVNGYTPGEPILPDLTLVEYWEKHYLPWAETNLKPSTLHGYKQAFNQHLKPAWQATFEGHHHSDGYKIPRPACRR